MKDGKQRILKSDKPGTVTRYDHNVKQSEGIYGGTVKLGKATKRHSGDYTLEEHGSDGILLRKVTVHLEIQAPVPKPVVSQTCLSPEQMTVSCSYEGDGAEIIFKLDSQLLIQTGNHRISLGNWPANKSSVTVNLHGQLTGNLTCQIKSSGRSQGTFIRLEACKAPVPKPVVSQTCLSPEKMTVSCSYEGDGAEIIFKLDSQLLIQTRNNSVSLGNWPANKSIVTVNLHGQLTGNLTCQIKSSGRSQGTFIRLEACKGI
ncbi:uncharacterized protein LOC125021602 [Mugil cephalus]|uniref:uncharacterized protein LOC125021602 n=1 Tax=Mugil cephalus TaxID=48193 RepID=UPI001FB69B81|nr:uncharacterized protein LOC125021602 [Mugil cephalus]